MFLFSVWHCFAGPVWVMARENLQRTKISITIHVVLWLVFVCPLWIACGPLVPRKAQTAQMWGQIWAFVGSRFSNHGVHKAQVIFSWCSCCIKSYCVLFFCFFFNYSYCLCFANVKEMQSHFFIKDYSCNILYIFYFRFQKVGRIDWSCGSRKKNPKSNATIKYGWNIVDWAVKTQANN